VDKYIKPIILNTIKININLIIIIEHGKENGKLKRETRREARREIQGGNYHQQLYTMS
jgi:hypothetical protein